MIPAPTLLVVLGPTGTGKSAAALSLAEVLGAEIVGCDAVQVYRGLDAATAKPSVEELRHIPHHLVDCVDPRTDFSLADYVRAADRAIEEVAGRGRPALVVGGTGLYLRGLLRGVIEAPARDPQLRDRLYRIIEHGGAKRLHRLLGRLDPESAERIPPADHQRTVRAIELAKVGDSTWSERLRDRGTWLSGRERYRSLKIGLDLDRDELGARLDARVDHFFERGLAEEVRGLLSQGVPTTANAFKAIGYREVLEALSRGEDPDGVREEVRRKTRRYAKRQRTWFRREPGVVWLDGAESAERIAERVTNLWRGVSA